jgi:hypothetical protein
VRSLQKRLRWSLAVAVVCAPELAARCLQAVAVVCAPELAARCLQAVAVVCEPELAARCSLAVAVGFLKTCCRVLLSMVVVVVLLVRVHYAHSSPHVTQPRQMNLQIRRDAHNARHFACCSLKVPGQLLLLQLSC